MFKFVIMVIVLMMICNLCAIIVETGSLKNFLFWQEPACQYDNWVSHLAEGIVVTDERLW